MPRVTLSEHHRAVLGYLWSCVCVFFINYTLFPVAVLPFPSLSSVGRSSNEQYVCIACYQEARFSEAFLLPSCINHTQIMKNVLKFAPFIPQSILSVAFMCQIWILNIFPVMFVLHNHHFVDFQFCSSREEIGK